jgi:hypothetical protein
MNRRERMRCIFCFSFVTVALSAACGAPPPTGEPPSSEPPQGAPGAAIKQLALGRAHGCSLDAAISGVLCWGDNRRGQTRPPGLSAPRFVATGGDVSCAIDGKNVKCWGEDVYGQLAVPRGISRPTQVAVGERHVCVLTAAGTVRCWGDDSYGQLRVAPLVRVRAIAAGARHTCALEEGSVTCWGDNSLGQVDVPELGHPAQLAVGGYHNCVIDEGTIQCWGGRNRALRDDIPPVNAPRAIAAGSSHACVADAAGVSCWGDVAAGSLAPRELTNVVALAVGGGDGFAHACARHQQGIACWGDNRLEQTEYDGYPLHVLYRAESEIDAPPSAVWDVLMDLDAYPQWNPYTVAMRSTLRVGDPMVMTVKMNDLVTIEQTEHIRVLEPGHKICWGINTDTPELNSGERCQWLEPVANAGTRYVTEDLIEGTLNPLVLALFGNDIQVGFSRVAAALETRVEALHAR